MADNDELRSNILSLHYKVDRALALLEGLQSRGVARARPPKPKPAPLTPEEAVALQDQFSGLYERWIDGNEIETQQTLEQLDADQLRRLADANNLNVTSKMSKEKVLHLIGARFREKKQLHKGKGVRDEQPI